MFMRKILQLDWLDYCTVKTQVFRKNEKETVNRES